MTRHVTIVALLAGVLGCRDTRDVRVLLGPDESHLSIGFRCRDEAGVPLAARALPNRRFALVIDMIAINGGVPACRSEDLAIACLGTDRCRLRPRRYCVDVPLDAIDFDIGDPESTLENLSQYLRTQDPVISADAPDDVVIVRAVATTLRCDEIPAGSLRGLARETLTGCAHSCPVRLDDVDGTISLSLDALTEDCELQALACAAFPDLEGL